MKRDPLGAALVLFGLGWLAVTWAKRQGHAQGGEIGAFHARTGQHYHPTVDLFTGNPEPATTTNP